MTTGQTDAGAVVPSGRLLAHCIRVENIADITETQLPSRWHPLRRAFMWGRVCCLRGQAANIRDIVRERSANPAPSVNPATPAEQKAGGR